MNLDMEEYRDLRLTMTAFQEVLDEPELTFTPRGAPDPRLLRLVGILARQAAQECYAEEVKMSRQRRKRSS